MEDEQKSFMEKVVGLNRKLYRFCLGKTGEAEAARDLSQEILLKARTSLSSLVLDAG